MTPCPCPACVDRANASKHYYGDVPFPNGFGAGKKSEVDKDFEILYNALSVGWHLGKIAEVNKDILNSKENMERFLKWLARHLNVPS